jgi:hypothetical protein
MSDITSLLRDIVIDRNDKTFKELAFAMCLDRREVLVREVRLALADDAVHVATRRQLPRRSGR